MSVPAAARRIRAEVQGTVQGVGFRPYVFRLAGALDLAGFVRNDDAGVVVEVEGGDELVGEFLERLALDAPPLARVERVTCEDILPTGERGFAIVRSAGSGATTPVTPDAATCDDCVRELFAPADRRFRYPFINCTNCGPRFTIVRLAPYDRVRTSMAGFTMCPACEREYADPADRRFHTQPNACPACGPTVRLLDGGAFRSEGDDAIRAAADALHEGRIVAVKGLGGYHLACRADDEIAVARLRARKRREDRPFAVMVADIGSAAEIAELGDDPRGDAERRLLLSRERPIVLIRARNDAPVAPSVAPRSAELGLMLPYSPLHYLLLADTGVPLVMTSGNLSNEPIAYRDEDALSRLGAIADLLLVHDREIETRTDDSVMHVVRVNGASKNVVLRRSRGFVPASIALPVPAPATILACGAELKNTFCLAAGDRAWLSHHIGDLGEYETRRAFEESIRHFERLLAVDATVVAHDLHPDYASTQYALDRPARQRVAVQHHHAHLAAVLAEHGETAPAIGAIYDGSGYGTDGTIWGGEFLLGDLGKFERRGHLVPVTLPGGDAAIREPWRMACVWLQAATGSEPDLPMSIHGVGEARWRAIARLARSGLASPVTTSVGRLFDAVAALAGFAPRVTYEGQAAIELAAAADRKEAGAYAVAVCDHGADVVLDPREMIEAIAADIERGITPATVSAKFHNALADATVGAACRIAERTRVRTLVISGGVFQNRLLLERTAEFAVRAGLRVLTADRVPPNDGGISFGQAAVAAWQLGHQQTSTEEPRWSA